MAYSTSATSPGTLANDNSYGTVAWTNVSNAASSNDSDASVFLEEETSNYLKATNFGFSIPTDATIVGIEVFVEKSESGPSAGDARTDSVKLVKGGTISGDDRASDDTSEWPSSDTVATFGGSNELWGLSWTDSDINASDFGVVFAVREDGREMDCYVDHISISIHYTLTTPETLFIEAGYFQDTGSPISIVTGFEPDLLLLTSTHATALDTKTDSASISFGATLKDSDGTVHQSSISAGSENDDKEDDETPVD